MTDTSSGSTVQLPEEGSGSLAPIGQRMVAFLIDLVLSALVASLFSYPHLPRNLSLVVFGCEYVVFSALLQATPGMALMRLRLTRVDRRAPLTLFQAVVRTILLMLLIPALFMDKNGRGYHDRITNTAVVRV
ncbi:MAG TPA: RDD family protein [Mycobacteriales bacterium]|nr:RDD family protein [Mycobacteriales bacterium]